MNKSDLFFVIMSAFGFVHLLLGVGYALAASETERDSDERMDGVGFLVTMLVWEYYVFMVLIETYNSTAPEPEPENEPTDGNAY